MAGTEHPRLERFVLTNIRLTGLIIGAGAYATVEEAAIPGAICAAKKIHDHYLNLSKDCPSAIRRVTNQFKRECLLMSTLCHPNIVKFLGFAFFPGSRLPALVMERLLTNLHDLLDPELDPPPPQDAPKTFFPLSLKCSILHDVACGLAYLHDQSPPVVHSDLSAKNILLTSGMVAKIGDLGVARMGVGAAAGRVSKASGASVYMPPEATLEKSKYDTSIDIFSLGIMAIFVITETFPCDPLPQTYVDETGLIVPRTELQRRSLYMTLVEEQLAAHDQLHEDHPFIRLIQQCLQNVPHKRPSIYEVLGLLDEASACNDDGESESSQV